MIELLESQTPDAVIKVVGVGGCGGNAVDHMINNGVQGVEFISMNTDAQALKRNLARTTLQLGTGVTKGLGAGADPQVGRLAAEEDRERIQELITGADMLFVTAGMGGGTGTGASPIIAQIAREVGALTVGVVTKPFEFEGTRRTAIAEQGIAMLKEHVDTLITIPNQRLLQLVDKNTPFLQAFGHADDVLRQGIQGISDLITKTGIINLDFADVKATLTNAGSALLGVGTTADATNPFSAKLNNALWVAKTVAEGGDGNAAARVRQLAATAKNVSVRPPVARHEFPALLASADVHVVLQRSVSAGANMPSKIAPYLASGRPIIASLDLSTPAAEVLRASGGAILVRPEAPAELAHAMRRLTADAKLRARLGEAGRAYAEEWLGHDSALGRLAAAILV